MPKRIGIEVSIAIAEAVKLCDVDIICAYPITPQTHIVEHLSELVANGELDAEFIPVESEHSAMSVAVGASATGARVYTATSAQGLFLMHEVLFIASGMRLPIVMTVANRALSAPISIWNDHSDIMA
ncbi:MAG TPA: pyruvate ferredoxin oxidoreductase, partial [Candidatus Desulfofervidus auxilii]|nr:pyruvate ferredoxin oxidoreductase [Candidatus Desulfofervidus auxilii]